MEKKEVAERGSSQVSEMNTDAHLESSASIFYMVENSSPWGTSCSPRGYPKGENDTHLLVAILQESMGSHGHVLRL